MFKILDIIFGEGKMRLKKYIYCGLLIIILGVGGCKAVELFTGKDNKPHTQLTDALAKASDITKGVGSFIPGYGLIATGVSALLGIIGSGILAFRTKSQGNKLNTAGSVIKTIVTGVNLSTKKYPDLKQSVLDIANSLNPDTGKKIGDVFSEFEKAGNMVKDTIKDLSELNETKIDVAKAVVKAEGVV